tara:strand:+ start:506 stop:781 length:276 start_codon:yes stop_codon:yes gene_type:complete
MFITFLISQRTVFYGDGGEATLRYPILVGSGDIVDERVRMVLNQQLTALGREKRGAIVRINYYILPHLQNGYLKIDMKKRRLEYISYQNNI